MSLANFDLDDLRAKIHAAYKADDPILATFRDYARRMKSKLRPLRPYSVNAVSFVSSDGGDNRLVFNPAVVELVRVVDSRGIQCALDAVGSNTPVAELEKRVQPGADLVSPLQRLCLDLGKTVNDLSYFLSGMGVPGKSTGAIRCYRDIVEWAVLYDLATNPTMQWGGDTILVHDGLLRTKSFNPDVFPKLDQLFRAGIQTHAKRNVRISLVGVAKRSAVLSRLAVALELEGVFHCDFPCYVEVDSDIEAECYKHERTWLSTFETADPDADGNQRYQSMGKMYLAKFGDRPFDPVWPVDVATWDASSADRVLGQLTVDAQQGFPIPDYPMCIQRAHDFAKLTGLEVEILQDILVDGMCSSLSAVESERLLRMKYLGQSLAALRYKEG